MSTSKTLGNAEPTEAERQRMLAVLNGLGARLNARGSDFAPATIDETTGTAELCWTSGGRPWVSAWINSGPRRLMAVWRHQAYRYVEDDKYLHEALQRDEATSHEG